MKFSLFSVMDHHPTEVDRSAQQFVQEFLQQTELAEALGYHCAWVAEHHFGHYGLITSPAVLLAAAAARTQRIRLGAAVVVLPLRHPVQVAEDYALVDLISGGRLNVGVGSGYLAHEFAPLGIPFAEKADRFNEALDVVRGYWTQDALTYAGTYTQVYAAQDVARPIQQPHPPVWVAVLRKEAAYHVGRKGLNITGMAYVTVQTPTELKAVIDAFKQGYAESGAPPETLSVPVGVKVYVAESREQALAEAREAMERYLRTRKYAQGGQFDTLLQNQLILVGDPDDVAAGIAAYRDAGVTEIMCLVNFGGLPHERVCGAMRLLADQVMPRFARA